MRKANLSAILTAVLTSSSMLLASCGGSAGTVGAERGFNDAPDPCAVAARSYGDVSVPAEYRGAFPIPQPSGKLPADVKRSMDLKDLDAWWSKPASNACTDRDAYIRNVYIEDLNRVSQLGVEQVWIFNYGPWDDFSKPVWSIDPADYAIPQNVFKTIVEEATRRGIKVYLSWQMNNSDKVGEWNSLDTGDTMTRQTLIKIMASYKRHLIHQAQIGAEMGLHGLAGDLVAFVRRSSRSTRSSRRSMSTRCPKRSPGSGQCSRARCSMVNTIPSSTRESSEKSTVWSGWCGSVVSITNYWHTDDLSPTPVSGNNAFPNLSSSIRNKPAEGIVKHWFSSP
jgi:hypothetical protein